MFMWKWFRPQVQGHRPQLRNLCGSVNAIQQAVGEKLKRMLHQLCWKMDMQPLRYLLFLFGEVTHFGIQNLQIRTVGTYTLKFIAVSSKGYPFAFAYSNSFIVSIGQPYTLSFVPYLGHVQGGTPFMIQPSVRITDRGGNTIASVNTGTVEAKLIQHPAHASDAALLPANNLVASFESGVASFTGLYIDKAGQPYGIAFSTSMVRPQSPILTSV
jgi:hypothetical protein